VLELDQHPEPPAVDALDAELPSKLRQRAVGYDADLVSHLGLVRADPRAARDIAADEEDRRAHKVAERLGPRPADHVSLRLPVVDVCSDRLVELDVAADDAAVGEAQPKPRRVRVGYGEDPAQRAHPQSIEQPAVRIDEVEPAVV